jgi:hypothetical protein
MSPVKYWITYVTWQLSIMGYVWLSGRLVGMIR